MQDSGQVIQTIEVPELILFVDTFSVPFRSIQEFIPEAKIGYTLPDLTFNSNDSVNSNSANQKQYINFYKGHELKTGSLVARSRENMDQDWFFPVFILVLALYTWLRIFYNKYFNQLLKAVLNTNLANQIIRDENILLQRASILLALTFNIIAALFLYLLSLQMGWSLGNIGHGFNRFAFFIIVVSLVYTFKFLILKIIGWLFELDREMATYMFNIFIINNLLGLILVPIVALMAYNPTLDVHFLAILSIWLIGIAFLYRIIRGILTGMTYSVFSPLYLFLYLCTLEIAPLLVLIRIVNP